MTIASSGNPSCVWGIVGVGAGVGTGVGCGVGLGVSGVGLGVGPGVGVGVGVGVGLALSTILIRRLSARVHSSFDFSRTYNKMPSSSDTTLNCTELAISKPAGAASSVRV